MLIGALTRVYCIDPLRNDIQGASLFKDELTHQVSQFPNTNILLTIVSTFSNPSAARHVAADMVLLTARKTSVIGIRTTIKPSLCIPNDRDFLE